MFIDKTYFVGEINIPSTGNASVLERLNFFIAKYEEELLRALLGDGLYVAFKDGIAIADPDQKWKDLRDGKDYQDTTGRAMRFLGLYRNDIKQSLIANYVYYWWMRDKASITTHVGEADAKTDGADKVNPGQKMCRAWNEMVQWNRSLVMFLDINQETYPEWDNRRHIIQCHFGLLSPINVFNL